MERLENLSIDQLEDASKIAKSNGYRDIQSVENIPIGPTSCNVEIITVDGRKTPCFGLIKLIRKDREGNELKLMYEAVMLNVLHISTGKSYNCIYTKISPELKTAISKPENWTKELIFNSVLYSDGHRKGETILIFESMSK